MDDMADFTFDRNINYVDYEMLADNEAEFDKECTIGCMINTQVGGHHRYCDCDCHHLPFTDTSAIEPEADSTCFHGQEAAV